MAQCSDRLPMALSMGDPAGIGPETILKAFAGYADHRLPIERKAEA